MPFVYRSSAEGDTSVDSSCSLEKMPLTSDSDYNGCHGTFVRVNSVGASSRRDSQLNDLEFTVSTDKLPERPSRRRLVEKNGQRNVRSRYIPKTRYFQDIFTTMIDAKWRWVMGFCMASYFVSWLLFSVVWYLILTIHRFLGDKKCLVAVNDFSSSFLLSVETQQTIGYGTRQLNTKCAEAIILLLVQSVVGELIEAIVLGLIFAKLARPGKRAGTIVFSKNAVIARRDGKLCLMFQACDVRKRQLLEVYVRLHLFRPKTTAEGKYYPYFQENLKLGFNWTNVDSDLERLLLLFPVTLCHIIDETSPFYGLSASELQKQQWELVVVLEGVVEATGSTTQARTSYLTDEIFWGHDFVDVVDDRDWSDEDGLRYLLDKIDEVYPTPTPNCSAKEYYTSQPMTPLPFGNELDEDSSVHNGGVKS